MAGEGAGRRQLRLLLWKDYLTRKRMSITLFGIIWAAGIMLAMYMVRINVDNQDFPTCQFPARALPSAGMLTFLQSFICSVGNECTPLKEFEEIPAYENAKLTQIRRQISPFLNDTVLELASSVPGAVKLLATVSDVADEPNFREFTLKGLKVENLFKDPSRVKRYVTSRLQLNNDVTQSLMTSDVSLQGLLNGSLDRCSTESISQVIVVQNKEHLKMIVDRLCTLTNEELQKIVIDLVYEIDFSKYIKMLGNMYYKLSGDERVSRLADFLTALLRMTKLPHFLPPEFTSLFLGLKTDFSYLNLDMVPKFLDLFRPTFGDTEEYKSIKEVADIAVVAVQYINKIFGNDVKDDVTDDVAKKVKSNGFDKLTKVFDNAMNLFESNKESNIDPYNVLTQLAKFVYKALSKDKKHDVLFYSTLIAKLMDSAHQVIKTNMHIEERTYNVTLRHPEAIKTLKKLPLSIVAKTFDALVSAERTQILTSKLNFPGQMFCDLGKLQNFFLISKTEADPIKEILCTESWKNFVKDIINAFGISEVKDNINKMASLLIQETLGKDTSSELYTIDQDFQILKNFISDLVTMEAEERPVLDWKNVLDLEQDSELMKTIKEKAHLAKLILISVHGALAKEIVKQNAILQYKITPILLDALTIITAFNEQLETIPKDVTEEIKKNYGDIVKTMLYTALDEEKTYKSLSTYCEDMLCYGGKNAEKYLNFPVSSNFDELSSALCNASIYIEKGLRNDSAVAKAIRKVMNTTHTIMEEVNWTKLINSIQKLYVKLDKEYPYLFEYSTYSMDNATQGDVQKLFDNVKNYWFSFINLNRALHLSLKFVFRLLDIMNHGIFNFKSEIWLRIKFAMSTSVGPLGVFDDFIQLVAALLTNSSHASRLPQITVNSLRQILPNLPQLIIDAANIIVLADTKIEPIIALMNAQPLWPCSTTSLSSLLNLSPSSAQAVQGLETIMCMDKDMQKEWAIYIDEKKARINKTLTYNTTEYDPHIFLQFSGVMDALLNDTVLVKDTLEYVFDESNEAGLKAAFEYAVKVINTTERNEILRKFLHNVDSVVNAIDTSTILTNVSMNALWNNYMNCISKPVIDDECRNAGRSAWKYTFRMLSVILDNIAIDMTTYFTEVHEPDSNILQMIGFTKKTPFYMLYDRLPDFVSVLLNSYWDFGFMSQIRRAAQTQFWDCEAVVTALVPPPESSIQMSHINKVLPYICPSFIYWLSMPKDDNVLFNLVAKPQYFFYSMPIQNATSKFEEAFVKATALQQFLDNINENVTNTIKDGFKIDNLEHKLAKFIDKILSFKLKETNPLYLQFNDIYRKQFISNIYLIRIVAITNKMAAAVNEMSIENGTGTNNEEVEKLNADLKIIKRIFKRKSSEAIAIMYDVLTEFFWRNDNSSFLDAMDFACNNANEKSKQILVDEDRIKLQLCAKNYNVILGQTQNILAEDYDDARESLMNVVEALRDEGDKVSDIFDFFNSKEDQVTAIRRTVKYSYDLGLPIFLKYLQSNLQSYNIVITFLSGGDWWKEIRDLYNGPYSQKFFGSMESGFEIADDVLNNLDGIHLVRLAHDLNLTDSQSFCRPNITLSDYLPDKTGLLSDFKSELCSAKQDELFKEIPPMLYASQGYDESLEVSNEVDYESIDSDINRTKSNLANLVSGPKEPRLPSWITDERLKGFRINVMNILSKETITKALFGLLSNGVDAGTLFLNNSYCAICSQMTSWFKQLNLQLFKKQEYDALLCRLDNMALDEVYHTLKNDFHWDMFITEVISTRNYTKYELNKSMNELLNLVKLHLLEDLNAPITKLAECLTRNVKRNELGNTALVLKVMSHTAKLLQAYTPHVHEVEGIKNMPYLKELYTSVAHNLDIFKPLKEYANIREELKKIIRDDEVFMDIEESDVNLKLARTATSVEDLISLRKYKWKQICEEYDCNNILTVVTKHLNLTKIDVELSALQTKSYWEFSFVSRILGRIKSILTHVQSLTGAMSVLDVKGAMEMKVQAVLDVLLTVLADDTFKVLIHSLQGVIEDLHPLLKTTVLEGDMEAIAAGLDIFHHLKTYLVEEEDLKLQVSTLFPNPEAIEVGLTDLGINNTNFWSIAAPRIHAGFILLKPILSPKTSVHISSYVCQIDSMSSVIVPGSLDVVTAEDVFAATADQFCGLPDERIKEILPVLLGNVDLNLIIDKVKSHLLTKLYAASELTPEEGDLLLSRFPRLAGLLPVLQENIGDVMDSLGEEPLFQDLKDFSSVGHLMDSSDFLSHAGMMVCGKPFHTPSSRIIKNIISSKDMSQEPDQAQLDVLPTDFCRSMYKDIVNMEGGKIVWSFVKPLIMGRILYTPPHPTVDRIIEKVNSTFSNMVQMANLVHSFAAAFPSVQTISAHKLGVEALQHLLTSPGLGELRRTLLGDQDLEINIDVDGMMDKLGDLKSIGSLLSKASSLLRCVNLDRLRAVNDETDLMMEAGKLMAVNEFSAGIVFMNVDQLNDSMSSVEYKIRMDIENAPTTKWMKPYLWTPGPESSFIENMRYFRGLIQIQDLLDKAIIQLAAEHSRSKREAIEDDWAMYTQQEPYPCYRKDFFQSSLYESQSLLVGLFFALLFTVASAVRFIVADKETGNTMLMSVMGVNLTYHTISWLISSLIEMTVTMAIVTIILKWGQVLPRTDPTLVFAILMVFAVSVLSFCYLMSKLFTSASFAAVSAGLAYLITFMPFILILSLEAVMDSSLKMFVCLSMSSSVMYSFLYVTRFEAMGVGAGWSDVWYSPNGDNMCIAYAVGMMCVDAALYAIVGYVIDIFFGIKSISSSITRETIGEQKAGVSIVNVSKIYGNSNKVALDNVSMDLRKGQITALLGHNGAGKTTLINILTGMLKPTTGSVIIRGENGNRLGVCPQKDVLFEYMTAREHIALYAQLMKGMDKEEVEKEVERMLRVLSLGAVSDVPAASLSGGTRRRLCVALAFVAKPTLVSLDEPTSGVDPSARRDIWSMIVKLKEDRTILLTTHHLDEAELLSDQIVIMHKGQIHTSGSPIEIKRNLGTGYKLSMTLPDRKNEWYSVEEKTKEVMALVRGVVQNASVVDVQDCQVEIGLPFHATDGSSNKFQQLCSTLEQQQATIGYKSFTMDCSTLEQVFFEICQRVDNKDLKTVDEPSKSASSSSIRSQQSLVPAVGVRRGTSAQQFLALMRARWIHHIRNRWLLFMLIALPSIFILVAMAFSTLRPPADNEIVLKLSEHLYPNTTRYLVSKPSIYSNGVDPMFAQHIMNQLKMESKYRDWNEMDTPSCKCVDSRQDCQMDKSANLTKPDLMVVPDVETLNTWLVSSQEIYLEDRYGGYTSTIQNNKTNLIAWYNNKGFHAMPSYLNSLNNAILRAKAGTNKRITAYSHPMKISQEQLSKNTVYQHVADAGVSALVFMSYSLVSAGSAIYLVSTRKRQEKRLQLLCGVSPALYWAVAMTWDIMIIFINMIITAILMWSFGFPVFVERNNLPAICILIILYGFACGSLVHLLEKLFSEASLANMVVFCGNTFLGLSGITLLLILDIISESDRTDNARWVLHKIFMLSPQFTLGDGLIEIAKNTIQAQVLYRFGMDTYRDPLSSGLVLLHYSMLVMLCLVFTTLNLAVEYGYFQFIIDRFTPSSVYEETGRRTTPEPDDVAAERRSVANAIAEDNTTLLSVSTIGNINRGFVHTEGKNNSVSRSVSVRGAAHLYRVGKAYGRRVAVRALSLAVPHGQCIALLGENGAGKSTTFAMLTGEITPTRGEIYIDGKLRNGRGLCRGLISYCPQSDAIDPLLTVRETLELYCRLRGITDTEQVISNTLETFELVIYKDVYNGALSGGNKRKLCSAIALAARAPLVLLDEPTSGMDPWSRRCVSRGVLSARASSRGVLLSTHALDDARRLADSVAILRKAELVATAPLQHCLTRFGGGYVISCRSDKTRAAWEQISATSPQAILRVMHDQVLHVLMPSMFFVEKKEMSTHLSDIFRVMNDLQAAGVIIDFTVNQSSLDQMFLNFTDKASVSLHKDNDDEDCLDNVTSL